jgi:hypothetical protein
MNKNTKEKTGPEAKYDSFLSKNYKINFDFSIAKH